jgi:hypothetical protein
MTTLPPSWLNCLEIWEPQPPGTPGPVQVCTGIVSPFCVLMLLKHIHWKTSYYIVQRDRQCYICHNLEALSCKHYCSGKANKYYMTCVCVYMCSLRYPLSHKWHSFWKKIIEHKVCVLSFFTTFVWNIFNSKKNRARYDQKCILVFMSSNCYSCQSLMKPEFSWQIIGNYSNIKLHANLSSGSRIVPSWQTDLMKL